MAVRYLTTLRRFRFSWIILAIAAISATISAGCTANKSIKIRANRSSRVARNGADGTLYVGWRVYLTNRQGTRIKVTALIRYRRASCRRFRGDAKYGRSLTNIRSPQSLLTAGLYLQYIALRYVNGKSIPPWCTVILANGRREGRGPWFLSQRGNWEFGARFGKFSIDPLTYDLINARSRCKISDGGAWTPLGAGSLPGGRRNWMTLTPDTFECWASKALSASPSWQSRLRAARPLQSIICGWRSNAMTIKIQQADWAPGGRNVAGKSLPSGRTPREGETGTNGR